jgi:hypothetical protein
MTAFRQSSRSAELPLRTNFAEPPSESSPLALRSVGGRQPGQARPTDPPRARIRTTPVSWRGHARLTREEWQAYGSKLGAVSNSSSWWLGDWVRFGQRQYTDHRYQLASHISGYDEHTLQNFAYVAGRYEASRRREALTWSHHAELASLEPADQDRWLDQATVQHLSVRRLRENVRHERRLAHDNAQPPLQDDQPDSTTEAADSLPFTCPHCGKFTPISVDMLTPHVGGHQID